MFYSRFLNTEAVVLSLTSGVSAAGTSNDIGAPEIASKYCAKEWGQLSALKPDAWAKIRSFENDPKISAAQTAAFNKYSAAVIALAHYYGSFVGLHNKKNQTPDYFKLAEAKYRLTMCLFPTTSERELLVEMAKEITDKNEDDVRKTLFGGFDHFFA